MTFIKSKEGQQIIWLDYCGYHLTDNQSDLTVVQTAVIHQGRIELYNKMNEVKK